MSKGEREITSKLVGERDHIKGEKKSQGPNLQEKVLRGRERPQGGEKVSRIPDVVKGEREISRERKSQGSQIHVFALSSIHL